MNAPLFVAIVLVSGALAGAVHGTVNLVIVEPYLDQAIGIENRNLFESGQAQDTPEFWAEYAEYREWQKGGQVLASVVLGISMGALFGVVFALCRKSLPGRNDVQRTLVLAGIMWVSLFVVPFLKYPANPPTVGSEETLVLRTVLYLSLVAISGAGAACFYKMYQRMHGGKRLAAVAGYVAFISAVLVVMPASPDEITIPMDLVSEFRLMSAVGVTSFWASVGLILGVLWNRYMPHRRASAYS